MESTVKKRTRLEEQAHEWYNALKAQAKRKRIGEQQSFKLVFTGSLVEVFDSVVANRGIYTKVRSILVETGSIEIVERGNRSRPTAVVLHHPPPPQESWPEDLTGSRPSATLYADMERRVKALEAWRETLTGGEFNIAEALRNMERRINSLEGKRK